MAVIATLVVGADGSTTKGGTSQGVTSGADRAQFLEHRRLADCIFIGGNTARTEPYLRTPVPVVVISHQLNNPLASNPLAHLWSNHNCDNAQSGEVGIEPYFGSLGDSAR